MNLGDPELEIIDPTPNVHTLFIHFDKMFFWTKLASRAVVRWSKKMYSCAGVCSYEGRGGLCDIALSEPLLKLRPRKDLVETLLHEMIHAYLFVTCQDQDRNGHGPNFKAHMHRINKSAGLNISIYHDFHDEVKLYQTHWWRCSGPCQRRKPHFGIVRRSMNRAPGPTDYWWEAHRRNCGGTFVKIKEPEIKGKEVKKKTKSAKPNADITRYINNNNQKTNNNNEPKVQKPVLKDSNSITIKTVGKVNGAKKGIATVKGNTFSPPVISPPVLFSGKGQSIASGIPKAKSSDVVETVRNVWMNKQLPTTFSTPPNNPKGKQLVKRNSVIAISSPTNPYKHKAGSVNIDAPPIKIKKIDDYFKTAATTVLKDVYGQDFKITQPNNDRKLVAVSTDVDFVDCPVCSSKVSSSEINKHLDECLNKEVIEKLSKDNLQASYHPVIASQNKDTTNIKDIVGVLPAIPNFKGNNLVPSNNILINDYEPYLKAEFKFIKPTSNVLNTAIIKTENTIKEETDSSDSNHVFDSNDINKVKSIVKKINYDKHIRKSENFIIPKEEKKDSVDVGYLPSFLDDLACEIINPLVKIEPGTSKDIASQTINKCACCSNTFSKPIEEHLDECLAFFANNTTIPEEAASTSFANHTIVIDDDDVFDETLTLNSTGTKSPCPCCMKMIEEVEMNDHLDQCLS